MILHLRFHNGPLNRRAIERSTGTGEPLLCWLFREEARGKSRRPSIANGIHRAVERFALTRVTQSSAGLAPISRITRIRPTKREKSSVQVRRQKREMTRRAKKPRRHRRTRFCVCWQRVTKRATRVPCTFTFFFFLFYYLKASG